MEKKSLVREWVERSFSRGVNFGDLWGGIGGNLITAWLQFHPTWKPEMLSLVWQVPLFGILGGIVYRLIATLFEMIRQARGERDGARAELAGEREKKSDFNPNVDFVIWGGKQKITENSEKCARDCHRISA